MRSLKSYLAALSLFLLVLIITLFALQKNQNNGPDAQDSATSKRSDQALEALSDEKAQQNSKDSYSAKSEDPSKDKQKNADSSKAKTIPPAKRLSEEEIKAKIRAGEPGYEVFASRLSQRSVALKPTWSKGDDWIVETYYRQMQASGDVWTGPAKWRFRVANEVTYRGEECWQFVINRLDDPQLPPSTIYITKDQHQLAGLETTVLQKGERRKLSYTPSADQRSKVVEARLSIIPFDLPSFGAKAKVVPAGLDSTPAFLKRKDKMPKDSELLGHGDEIYKVRFSQPSDKTRVRQRWASTDLRWPVESRTETTWSFRRKKQ